MNSIFRELLKRLANYARISTKLILKKKDLFGTQLSRDSIFNPLTLIHFGTQFVLGLNCRFLYLGLNFPFYLQNSYKNCFFLLLRMLHKMLSNYKRYYSEIQYF